MDLSVLAPSLVIYSSIVSLAYNSLLQSLLFITSSIAFSVLWGLRRGALHIIGAQYARTAFSPRQQTCRLLGI